MSRFLAFSRTYSADYDALASPVGLSTDLYEMASAFRQVSRDGQCDVWGLVATPTARIVGWLTLNSRLLGADSPYAVDSGQRQNPAFYGLLLEDDELVPEFDMLQHDIAQLIRTEAERILQITWRRPFDRQDTTQQKLQMPIVMPSVAAPLDLHGVERIDLPAVDSGLLWESARATQWNALDSPALILLKADLPARPLPLKHAFLAICSDMVLERREVRRAVPLPSGEVDTAASSSSLQAADAEQSTKDANAGKKKGRCRLPLRGGAILTAVLAAGAALAAGIAAHVYKRR